MHKMITDSAKRLQSGCRNPGKLTATKHKANV